MAAGGKKNLTDEVARLEALVAEDPSSVEFHKLADSYTRQGRFADAIRVCRQGMKHHPSLGAAHVSLGRAFFGAANLPKAIQSLRRALELPGTGAEAFRLLGEVLLWHEAPTEAVAVLEEALAKGFSERSIQVLLERARKTLDDQATGVVSVSDLERGIGNRAVAGTIGGTGVNIHAVPDDVTRRVPLSEEHDPTAERKLPEATPDGKTPRAEPSPIPRAAVSPRRTVDPPGWKSIDDQWSQQLDAQTTLLPEVEPEAPVPRLAPTESVLPLEPLIDPLAEGMPPLPQENEDSGVTPMPELVADAPTATRVFPRATDDARATAVRATEPRPPRRDPEPEPETAVALKPVRTPASHPLALAATREAPAVPAPAPLPSTPPRAVPKPANDPSPPPLVIAPSRNVGPTLPLLEPGADPGDLRLLEALAIENPVDDRHSQDNLPAPARMARRVIDATEPAIQRPRRRRGWLVVFLVMVLLGGGGFLGWQHFIGGDSAKSVVARAARARALGTLAGYREAGAELKRARSRRWGTAPAAFEADLVAALAWLEYRVGEPPPQPSVRSTGPEALVEAAVALAENDALRARSALEKSKTGPSHQALRSLLLGWSSWIEGDRTEAIAEAGRAARLDPQLAGAHLLEAHLRREIGDLAGAESAVRRALQISPRHEAAALTLAGVLLEKDGPAGEIDGLIGRGASDSPVLQAWHKLLVQERQFRNGEQGVPLGELPTVLGAAPTPPALLFRAVQVLVLGAQFDAARDLLDRLAKIRTTRDPATLALDAERQIAQGLERRALETLGNEATLPKLRRTRALAQLLLHRPQDALIALGDEDSPAALTLRLLAKALSDRGASLDPLRQAAEGRGASPLARLAHTLALIARADWAAAASAAQDLATCPFHRYRALTWLAQAQLQQGQLDAAHSLVNNVVGGAPLFYPAQELRGEILLRAGRTEEAASALSLASKAGRKSAELAGALARAHALAGRVAEASAAIEAARQLGASAAELARLTAYRTLAEGKLPRRLRGQTDGAEAIYLVALGDALQRAGRPADAEKAWQAALTSEPAHPLPLLRLASLHVEQRKDTAPTELQTVLSRASARTVYSRSLVALAHLGIARFYLDRKESGKEVVEHVEAAIKADPGSGIAHRVLAETQIAGRRFKLARRSLERAASLDPEEATTFFLLGTAAKCERKRAQDALKRFLELEPKGKRAAVARRALARLR